MSLFIISLTALMSFLFIFLQHPLSLGFILLIETVMIALITGMMNFNFWFSYIIFLIMVGGMLILFIYMTSIASNEKFKFSSKLLLSSFMILMIMTLFLFMDPFSLNLHLIIDLNNQNFSMNSKLSMNKFINWPINLIFFSIIIYLFITLIMVVKITNIKSGPLRQNL